MKDWCHDFAGETKNSNPPSALVATRVIIHGHHPKENRTENQTSPKLILLPDAMEDLFKLVGMTTFMIYAWLYKILGNSNVFEVLR